MTIHKERRERIQDKNVIIKQLNQRITFLNQEIAALRMVPQLPPTFISVIEDKGTHLEVKTIIRQSHIQGGYELLII